MEEDETRGGGRREFGKSREERVGQRGLGRARRELIVIAWSIDISLGRRGIEGRSTGRTAAVEPSQRLHAGCWLRFVVRRPAAAYMCVCRVHGRCTTTHRPLPRYVGVVPRDSSQSLVSSERYAVFVAERAIKGTGGGGRRRTPRYCASGARGGARKKRERGRPGESNDRDDDGRANK